MGVESLRFNISAAHALAGAKTLAAFCREHEIDVIHAQYPAENIVALLSRRYYPRPNVVYTGHLIIDGGAKWRIINRIFTPKNKAVIAVCSAGRGALMALYPRGARFSMVKCHTLTPLWPSRLTASHRGMPSPTAQARAARGP